MTVIQVCILFFAGFAITRTLFQFKRGALTIVWFLFWVIFWFAAGLVAVTPQTTDVIARFVGVGRGADVVIYVSLTALFYFIFRLYVKIEQVESEVTHLERKLSLDEFRKNKDD